MDVAKLGEDVRTRDGLDTPVAPGSTVGGVAVANALKAANKIGYRPKVVSAWAWAKTSR